jgi:hypothetical protein
LYVMAYIFDVTNLGASVAKLVNHETKLQCSGVNTFLRMLLSDLCSCTCSALPLMRPWAQPPQELANLRKRLKALRVIQHRQQVDDQNWGLTARVKLVCLAVYVLPAYDEGMAAEFVQQARKRRKADSGGWRPERPPVEEWFLRLPLPEVTAFDYPETEMQRKVRQDATKFLAQCQSWRLVQRQNYDRRAAPASLDVISKYSSVMGGVGLETSAAALNHSAIGSNGKMGRFARRWCQQFRKRWGLSLGHVKCRDELPAPEVEQKACHFESIGLPS